MSVCGRDMHMFVEGGLCEGSMCVCVCVCVCVFW